MENNKTKTVAIDFSKDKKRALRILANEKKAREAMREKYKQKKSLTPQKEMQG